MILTHEKIVNVIKNAANEFPLANVEYFGSYAEGQATEKSDLDLLVEFDVPDISILTIIKLKHYLEEELGNPVDVIHKPLPKEAIIEIGRTVSVL